MKITRDEALEFTKTLMEQQAGEAAEAGDVDAAAAHAVKATEARRQLDASTSGKDAEDGA